VKPRTVAAILVLSSILGSGCASQKPPRATAPPPEVSRQQQPAPEPTPQPEPEEKPKDEGKKGKTEKGLASWYGEPYHGRRTASGEIYDMHEMTAAHRTLAFGTVVKVERRDTGADVKVRVNDRGPFVRGRIIDLSYAAARKIDLDRDGVAPVKVTVVGFEDTPKKKDAEQEKQRAAPEPVGGDCLWIQVGAFGDISNARRAERRLEDAGEAAVIIEGPNGLHRVRLGPFDNEKDAVKALERISNDWPEAKAVPCG
jgi:rare lipoprotein A